MEELITFETAKLAKEKGFPQNKKRMIGKYREDGNIQRGGPCAAVCDTNKEWFNAPTQSLLQKWLREKHNIYINPQASNSIDSWFDIYYKHECIMEKDMFRTYEDALEKGLIEALKLIK